ncbi:hypothetical protein N7541_004661 [Penicillium brevicompactum]|uniref:Alcohol acetyltransferase n=1 Tax=Penicillium brevicompactum TaxID=5074 RepID=A0A9W9UU30_PENBR|nr:hypothetical protein N7541_004661 [Penicillium brevicompactum]
MPLPYTPMVISDLGSHGWHAEKYSTTRSHLGIYNNVGLTAHYKRSTETSVKSALCYALSNLISNHPILSAVPLAVETPNPYFVRLPAIPLEEVITFMTLNIDPSSPHWRAALDKTLEEQHNSPFLFNPDRPLPFWRISILESEQAPESFTLVFMFHHALMDTKSALSFHDELETRMNQVNVDLQSGERVSSIRPPSDALVPPLEDLYTLPISEDFLRTQENPNEPSPDSWTGSPQFTPVKTRFSSLWLSNAHTRTLAALSKKEGSSVTAVLQTLIATCLFSALPPEYKTLQADCAVSLRSFLPQPVTATTMGCYVGSVSTVYQRAHFNWNEARRTKTVLNHAMALKGGDMGVGYLRFVENQHHWMLQKLGRKRMAAFELSNVGVGHPSPRGAGFEVGGMLFSQSSSACSAAIKISAVTGRDGRLALGFTWQEGVVDDEMIEWVQQALGSQVEELVSK